MFVTVTVPDMVITDLVLTLKLTLISCDNSNCVLAWFYL